MVEIYKSKECVIDDVVFGYYMDFCGDEKRFQSKFPYITLTKPLMSFGSLGTLIMISCNELLLSCLVYLNKNLPLKRLISSIDHNPFLCFYFT